MDAHGGAGRVGVLSLDGVEDLIVLAVHAVQVVGVAPRRLDGSDARARDQLRAEVRQDALEIRVARGLRDAQVEGEVRRDGVAAACGVALERLQRLPHGLQVGVAAALRAITGNDVNVLAMGAFYVAPQMGCDIADAYLNASLGSGYEWWTNFYEFHKLSNDEMEAFNYEEYKANGFKLKHMGDYPLKLEIKPEE